MCYSIQKFIFLCGHSEFQEPRETAPCIFDEYPKICYELGNLRTLLYFENRLCPKCGSWKPATLTSIKPGHLRINTPYGHGNSDVEWLKNRSWAPSLPPRSRKEEIDLTAREILIYLLEDPSFWQVDQYEWLVRYIASLPSFVDRKGLVRTLEPSLGHVFDEAKQEELVPLFVYMDFPDIFARSMSWRRTIKPRDPPNDAVLWQRM